MRLATLGPVGLMPLAPGTWGSAIALLMVPWILLPLSLSGRLLVLITILFCGTWASTKTEAALGHKDPSCVVIDEVLGQLITFLPLTELSTWTLFAGFILFRALDIAKPWPIRLVECYFPKGLGIMVDDLLAGVLAAAILCFALKMV